MVKGKTKSGIKFQLNENVKNDARLLFYMTELERVKVTDDMDDAEKVKRCQEQSKYIFDMLRLIFGTDDGLMQFMNAVADAHEGVCNTSVMMLEITEMFEALNLKNS